MDLLKSVNIRIYFSGLGAYTTVLEIQQELASVGKMVLAAGV